jgi:hypothetical protein
VAKRSLMMRRTRRNLPRVTASNQIGTSVSQAVPLGDASLRAASATGAFIAAFNWQPLSGGVMIGAAVGRMTSRFGESRGPKYGPLMALPENG